MNEQEKILLLELILRDIRGNWGWENAPRVPMALELAKELELNEHVKHIEDYDYEDGRHFRTSVTNGGYEGMGALHGLEHKLTGRSEEFIQACKEYLTYPDSRVEDWKYFA